MPHAAHRLPHAAHRAEAPPRPSVSQWRTATSAAEAVEKGEGGLPPTLAARSTTERGGSHPAEL